MVKELGLDLIKKRFEFTTNVGQNIIVHLG